MSLEINQIKSHLHTEIFNAIDSESGHGWDIAVVMFYKFLEHEKLNWELV